MSAVYSILYGYRVLVCHSMVLQSLQCSFFPWTGGPGWTLSRTAGSQAAVQPGCDLTKHGGKYQSMRTGVILCPWKLDCEGGEG